MGPGTKANVRYLVRSSLRYIRYVHAPELHVDSMYFTKAGRLPVYMILATDISRRDRNPQQRSDLPSSDTNITFLRYSTIDI